MNKWKNNTQRMDTHFFVSQSTNNVNNRIIDIDNLTESHKEERRIGNIVMNKTMMTHCHGTKALHKINRRENFGIICMMDNDGDSPPKGTIKLIQV